MLSTVGVMLSKTNGSSVESRKRSCKPIQSWTIQLEFLGDCSGEDTPVPISNTEVKFPSADGTAWATGWESRSSPGYFSRRLFGSVEPGSLFYTELIKDLAR